MLKKNNVINPRKPSPSLPLHRELTNVNRGGYECWLLPQPWLWLTSEDIMLALDRIVISFIMKHNKVREGRSMKVR